MSFTLEPASVDPAIVEPPAPALVSMRGISKSYGERKILDGISLDVAQREKVALIGPSGSGKTTILRLAIGLVKPDAGTIRIGNDYLWHEAGPDGLRPAGERHARKVRRSVGIVFQHFNLFPHMTALQNVREPLVHVLGLSRAESDASAIDLLSQVGLKDHLDKRPAQLSGGQQQRVAIARSLALRPKVMLFDEVTSALDPELVGEVLRVMQSLAEEGRTMIVVTHEMGFARNVSNHAVFLHQGRIEEQGDPREVLTNPQSERVRRFLSGNLK
jgi:ABC-type histidine transport system ATPase subunit